ncbi:MAG: class I SAM-dependent methyltransferase [Betaproteobacteria bacterium]
MTRAGIPCNLCQSTEVTVLATQGRDNAPLRTVACRACGLVWSDPRPHDARRFYSEDYRLEYKGSFVPRPKHVLRAGRVALARLGLIRPLLRPGLRILDIGSGGGEFAYLLRSLGHQVEGVEPNRGYAEFSMREYGLQVHRGFVDEVALQPGRYDLITIWHVLEHTENPAAVLRQLREALAPGGALVVEVPNVEGPRRSVGSTFHEAHLYNFNDATLAAMGAQADLKPLEVTPSPDRGNLVAVFRREAVEAPSAPVALPGNHERVAASVLGHRTLAYWTSARPYTRIAHHLWRPLTEAAALCIPLAARERLDALYADAVGAARRKPQWLPGLKAVAAVYLLAIFIEWLLLDLTLEQRGWSDWANFWVFNALLLAVAAALVYRERPRHKLAGWMAAITPLVALPVVC